MADKQPDRSVKEIEADISASRDRLARSVDELAYRVNPQTLKANAIANVQGRVQDVIIWNEPNLSLEWGGRAPDPEAYAELLRVSYAAAHAANPDVRVLGGALAPTLETSGSAMSDLAFLERLYEASAAQSRPGRS